MARTPREIAADLLIGSFCLLRLVALWVVFLLWEILVMFKKLRNAHKSKVVIVNAAIAIAAAAPGVIEAVGPMLGDNAAAKALGAISVLNILLRMFATKVPIEQK